MALGKYILLPLLAAASAASAEPVRKTNPVGVAKPIGMYSHLAVVPPGTRLLYTAGQVGNRPDGSVPETIEEQVIQAMENVRTILASEGAKPSDIVKMTFYATKQPTDWGRIVSHRREMYKGTEPPPGTWVYVSSLMRPEFLVEVEVVAAVPVK